MPVYTGFVRMRFTVPTKPVITTLAALVFALLDVGILFINVLASCGKITMTMLMGFKIMLLK